jgi:hypothetical protein
MKMCWHRWGKWSELLMKEGVNVYYMDIIETKRKPVFWFYQERYCSKCGKYQKQIVEEIFKAQEK